MVDVRIRLLGPVTVRVDDRDVDLGGPTARAVLAVLVLQGTVGAGTAELISSVWGGPGAATRDSVYHYVATLRSALAASGMPACIEARQSRYRLAVAEGVVDWHQFKRLRAEGRRARDAGDPERAAALFTEALRLWTGPPLTDVGDRLAPQRAELAARRLAVVEELAAVEAGRGRADRVVELLDDECTREPGREHLAALLIGALGALGRREEAGAVFHRTRRYVTERLGLDPGRELEAAYRAVLYGEQGRSSVPASAQPVGSSTQAAGAPEWWACGLPRPDRHFSGREDDLRQVLDAMRPGEDPVVCAVSGMGGVGKTALAVQATVRLADQYPDGCVFIDLYGHSDSRPPLTAAEALDRLLRRLGVDGERVPPDEDERVRLYRELLAGRRTLIVLDNARDTRQVLPLVPATTGCGAIVTSRRRLVALDDAGRLSLDTLAAGDAAALFRSIVGTARLTGEADADRLVGEIVEVCARLPLAVRIVAARHRARDRQTLRDLARRLKSTRTTLAELDDGDRSVAASFQLSLDDLPEDVRTAFGLLAVHPGPDFDTFAAAALIGQPYDDACRILDVLVDRHLLVEHADDRYLFHDLIHAFARQHAVPVVPGQRRDVALRALVDGYLSAAERADMAITPHRYRVPLDVRFRPQVLPSGLDDYDTALAWLTTEQANLVDVCRAAGAAGLDVSCWQLAYTLRGHYFLAKLWGPWLATHEVALAAARRCGDTLAEAMITNQLGLAHIEQGHLEVSADFYRRARHLFAQAGDAHGEQTVRANLAWVLFEQRRFEEFLDETEPVYRFYRDAGSQRNMSITLRGIGLAEAELGRSADAVRHLGEALNLFEQLDLRLDVAMTLNCLGESYARCGEHLAAVEAHERAIAASQRCGSAYEQARAHYRLGRLAIDSGQVDRAAEHWAQALAGYQRVGAPQAAEVRAALSELTNR
ncbi:MAG: tetratricopeptide repeat protein [Dactylosporangium sp.]|nr:tetratricopeptide repeat protein [Dactylosporangium sp.]NNJ60734.1 tetratricopeptide repeat protein [Dactylosporangium sp.]